MISLILVVGSLLEFKFNHFNLSRACEEEEQVLELFADLLLDNLTAYSNRGFKGNCCYYSRGCYAF